MIVVDDCSTDGTGDLVLHLVQSAPVPLRLIRCKQNSGGPAHPMDVGTEASSSEVVAFFDQDDLMCKEKVELVSQALGGEPRIGLAFGQFRQMDESGVPHPLAERVYDVFPKQATTLGPGEVFFSILNHDYRFGGAGGTAITKQAWKDLRGFNPKLATCWDRDFALRLACRRWSVAYVPHRVLLPSAS